MRVASQRPGDREDPHRSSLLLGLEQREVDLERDVVAEGVAAVRELHLPLEAEVAPVDDGCDLDAGPQAAAGRGDGLTQVPAAAIGRVLPAIVSSPSRRAVPSSESSTFVDRNVTSGWLSASKNSAPST